MSAQEPVTADAKTNLVEYMHADTREARSAAYLRTYAARIRDKSEVLWEIPNTRAQVLEDIANLLDSYAALLVAHERLKAEIDSAWEYIEMGYDIETRAEVEASDMVGTVFKSPLAMAMHLIWKRDRKVR